MRRPLFGVFGAGLACLVLLMGCGRSEVARSCITNADCEAGQICAAGYCESEGDVVVPTDSSDDTDTADDVLIECSSDDDCGPALCSVDDNDACMRQACNLGSGYCESVTCEVVCPPATVQQGCDCVSVGCQSDTECAPFLCLDAVCSPCSDDGQCSADGSLICDQVSGECVRGPECATDDECPPHLRCVNQFCEDRPRCTLDRDCPANELCLAGRCTWAPDCTDDADCGAFAECIGGTCHITLCRGADDCAEGEVCDGGACVIPAVTKQCRVATQDGIIAPNQRIRLEAFAFDDDGRGIAANFRWESSEPAIVSIDRNEAVGGTTSGIARITAVLAGGDPIVCEGSVRLENLGLVFGLGLRVVVTHEETRRPIEGAEVYVNGAGPVRTNASGVAETPRPQGAYELTVIADGFNYLTVQDINAPDVRIPLSVARGSGPVGGFTGEFDLSLISSAGDINLGLAGASLAGGLLDVDLQRLLGETFQASVNIPGIGGGDFPLPGGVVAYGRVFNFNLDVKRTYYANTSEGARLGWGLAGKVPFRDMLALFTGGIDGGFADVLATILPLFNRFDHGIEPLFIEALPRVVDTNDINGNGNRTELVPDYRNFPRVDLRPNVRQQLATDVRISNFPLLDGSEAAVAVLIGGTLLDGPGFVPMGISATADGDENGRPDNRILYMAAPHGSAVGGRYVIMALAIGGGQGGDGMTPTNFSAALWNGQNLPTTLSLGTFPDSTQGSVNRQTRTVDLVASAGPIYRVRVMGSERSWDVWAMGPAGTMGEFRHSLTVPAAPGTHADVFPGATITVDAIRTSVSLDDLVRATGVGLRNTGLVTTSFNRTLLP
jgi:hypothetical protein